MKTIEKSMKIYQAFDGTEFANSEECINYETEKEKEIKVNLKNFEIEFPMQNSFTYCRAYLVKSENEFQMLKAYVLNEYGETYGDYIEYNGNGWYVVEGDDAGHSMLYKLSSVIEDWNNTLTRIMKQTIDFE